MLKKITALLVLLACLLAGALAGASEQEVTLPQAGFTAQPIMPSANPQTQAPPAVQPAAAQPQAASGARDAFINRIIALAEKLFQQAGGKAQRAHYAGDIYVCKNFTVHVFRENAKDYRMAAFPDVALRIPNNLSAKASRPSAYGAAWENILPKEGNPFYAAASFQYDAKLTKEENRELARAMLRQVKRGDFFQMSGQSRYGVGAHSLIFIADYDPATDTLTWTDSNLNGKMINGERYGYVKFGTNQPIDWIVDAINHKTRGATVYRLRDDIMAK